MSNDFAQDDALVAEFLVESEELLQGMDQDMVTLEATPKDADLLNRIFRALHTIKGTSGFLGFDPIIRALPISSCEMTSMSLTARLFAAISWIRASMRAIALVMERTMNRATTIPRANPHNVEAMVIVRMDDSRAFPSSWVAADILSVMEFSCSMAARSSVLT